METLLAKYNDILNNYFGYKELKKEQFEIINELIKGNDVMAILTTGYGKSICFQMPYIITKLCVIVISPLLALMTDQEEQLERLGIPVVCLNSNTKDKNLEKEKILSGEYKIIYITPEYFVLCEDFVKTLYETGGLSLISVDESHCSSQWSTFRPSYAKLFLIKEWLNVPVLAVTATASKHVREDICRILKLENPYVVIGSFDRPNLSLSIMEKTKNIKNDIKGLLEKYKDKYCIIYCKTKKDTEKLSILVNELGYKCEAFHAGINNNERARIQDEYTKGKVKVLCATICFGLGVNIANIRLIIHYGCSQNLENYYQEIGRAGRDGNYSECTMFYSPKDFYLNKFMTENIEDATQRKYQDLQNKKIRAFVYTNECRRKLLLSCFDEINIPEKCTNCDNCNKKKYIVQDFTLNTYKLLTLISQLGSDRGSIFFINVLRGSNNKKMKYFKNHLLYGTGYGHNELYWKTLIRDLTVSEYIDEKKLKDNFGSTIYCTSKAMTWLSKINNKYYDILFGENINFAEEDKIYLQVSMK